MDNYKTKFFIFVYPNDKKLLKVQLKDCEEYIHYCRIEFGENGTNYKYLIFSIDVRIDLIVLRNSYFTFTFSDRIYNNIEIYLGNNTFIFNTDLIANFPRTPISDFDMFNYFYKIINKKYNNENAWIFDTFKYYTELINNLLNDIISKFKTYNSFNSDELLAIFDFIFEQRQILNDINIFTFFEIIYNKKCEMRNANARKNFENLYLNKIKTLLKNPLVLLKIKEDYNNILTNEYKKNIYQFLIFMLCHCQENTIDKEIEMLVAEKNTKQWIYNSFYNNIPFYMNYIKFDNENKKCFFNYYILKVNNLKNINDIILYINDFDLLFEILNENFNLISAKRKEGEYVVIDNQNLIKKNLNLINKNYLNKLIENLNSIRQKENNKILFIIEKEFYLSFIEKLTENKNVDNLDNFILLQKLYNIDLFIQNIIEIDFNKKIHDFISDLCFSRKITNSKIIDLFIEVPSACKKCNMFDFELLKGLNLRNIDNEFLNKFNDKLFYDKIENGQKEELWSIITAKINNINDINLLYRLEKKDIFYINSLIIIYINLINKEIYNNDRFIKDSINFFKIIKKNDATKNYFSDIILYIYTNYNFKETALSQMKQIFKPINSCFFNRRLTIQNINLNKITIINLLIECINNIELENNFSYDIFNCLFISENLKNIEFIFKDICKRELLQNYLKEKVIRVDDIYNFKEKSFCLKLLEKIINSTNLLTYIKENYSALFQYIVQNIKNIYEKFINVNLTKKFIDIALSDNNYADFGNRLKIMKIYDSNFDLNLYMENLKTKSNDIINKRNKFLESICAEPLDDDLNELTINKIAKILSEISINLFKEINIKFIYNNLEDSVNISNDKFIRDLLDAIKAKIMDRENNINLNNLLFSYGGNNLVGDRKINEFLFILPINVISSNI